jgi:hypothetical protein
MGVTLIRFWNPGRLSKRRGEGGVGLDRGERGVVSVPVPPDRKAPAVPADFSIMAPSSIRAGRNFVVEVWVAPSGSNRRHGAAL